MERTRRGQRAGAVDWAEVLVFHLEREEPMTTSLPEEVGCAISCDRALAIARTDAEQVYRHLSRYRITLTLEADGWHVDYELKDPYYKGGGPHYVIDPNDGSILSKRYEQ